MPPSIPQTLGSGQAMGQGMRRMRGWPGGHRVSGLRSQVSGGSAPWMTGYRGVHRDTPCPVARPDPGGNLRSDHNSTIFSSVAEIRKFHRSLSLQHFRNL